MNSSFWVGVTFLLVSVVWWLQVSDGGVITWMAAIMSTVAGVLNLILGLKKRSVE